MLLALRAFDFTWVAGLAAFGVHLILLGRLLLLTADGPRVLAWVLVAAGTAYVVDTVAHLALADYEAWSTPFLVLVGLPSVVGELWLTIWLLRVATGRRTPPVAAGGPAPRSVTLRPPPGGHLMKITTLASRPRPRQSDGPDGRPTPQPSWSR